MPVAPPRGGRFGQLSWHWEPEERIATVLPLAAFQDDAYLIQATMQGEVKRTPLAAYATARQAGREDDGPGTRRRAVWRAPHERTGRHSPLSPRPAWVFAFTKPSYAVRDGPAAGYAVFGWPPVIGSSVSCAQMRPAPCSWSRTTATARRRWPASSPPNIAAEKGVRALLTDEKAGQVVGCASVRSGDTEILAASTDGLMLRVPPGLESGSPAATAGACA